MQIDQTCEYQLHCPPVPDLNQIAVAVNGADFPMDAGEWGGWRYTDATSSVIELTGKLCQDVLDGGATVVFMSLCTP